MSGPEDLVKIIKEHGPESEEAFQQLYEMTRQTALAVIRRYCDIPGDYEDLLQETYIQVYKSIDTLRDDTKILAWIRRIAGNYAVRHNMKKWPKMFSEMADEEGNVPEIQDESEHFDPAAISDRKAVSEIVTRFLDGLPDEQRTALWMVYGQQITIREMAANLGVSENTIKSRLYQGRNKLLAKKEEFRKLGVELTAIPVALLIAMAFDDTVSAAPGAVVAGSGAIGAAAAADKAAAGKAAETSLAKAGMTGKVAAGAAIKRIPIFSGLSAGAKAGIVAAAILVTVGGGTAIKIVADAHSQKTISTEAQLEEADQAETSVNQAEASENEAEGSENGSETSGEDASSGKKETAIGTYISPYGSFTISEKGQTLVARGMLPVHVQEDNTVIYGEMEYVYRGEDGMYNNMEIEETSRYSYSFFLEGGSGEKKGIRISKFDKEESNFVQEWGDRVYVKEGSRGETQAKQSLAAVSVESEVEKMETRKGYIESHLGEYEKSESQSSTDWMDPDTYEPVKSEIVNQNWVKPGILKEACKETIFYMSVNPDADSNDNSRIYSQEQEGKEWTLYHISDGRIIRFVDVDGSVTDYPNGISVLKFFKEHEGICNAYAEYVNYTDGWYWDEE